MKKSYRGWFYLVFIMITLSFAVNTRAWVMRNSAELTIYNESGVDIFYYYVTHAYDDDVRGYIWKFGGLWRRSPEEEFFRRLIGEGKMYVSVAVESTEGKKYFLKDGKNVIRSLSQHPQAKWGPDERYLPIKSLDKEENFQAPSKAAVETSMKVPAVKGVLKPWGESGKFEWVVDTISPEDLVDIDGNPAPLDIKFVGGSLKDDLPIPTKLKNGRNLYNASKRLYTSTDFNIYLFDENILCGSMAGYTVVIRENRVKNIIFDEEFIDTIYSSLRNSKPYAFKCVGGYDTDDKTIIEDFQIFFENNHFVSGKKGVYSTKEFLEKDRNSERLKEAPALTCNLVHCELRDGWTYIGNYRLRDDKNGPAAPFGFEDVLLKRNEALDK